MRASLLIFVSSSVRPFCKMKTTTLSAQANDNLWSGRMLLQLILRLGLTMVVYTICRLIFYVYNADLLAIDDLATWGRIMIGGLRFDLSGVIYTNLLVILLHLLPLEKRYAPGYQRAMTITYWICNIPMVLMNLADVVYFRFSGRRTSKAVFDEFANEDPTNFLHFFVQYWPITLTGIALIALWVWAYRLSQRPIGRPTSVDYRYYLASSGTLVVGAFVAIVGMRGSLMIATRPIGPNHASAYVARPEQRSMVLNTPFVMIRTAGKHVLPALRYMSEEEATKLFDPVRTSYQGNYAGMMRGRNVVIIIWESLAREWVGSLNRHIPGYEGYTPFLDSLISRSCYWPEAYAGGGKSIDAMPSILASVPRPMTHFVGSPYSGNHLSSLADALKGAGYQTAFFHNGHNGSMGFDAMARQLGFEHYYGMNEYGDPADYDGKWGIWDEPFLQYISRQLGTLQEPFLAVEFTTSSHDPYKIPEQYRERFTEGEIPLHKCIRYTDHALREFFHSASRQPWYNNTLFLITGDHSVPGALEQYKTSVGAFSVPMILFDPRGELTGERTGKTVQQADVLPTLVHLLGIDYPMVAFGHNMLSDSEDHFAINALDNTYQMIRGDYVLQYDGQQVVALYNKATDPMLRNNLRGQLGSLEAELVRLMQAYLQSYTNRMRDNRMVVGR